jgi:RNA polymerase sigma-70 factor (ECF subfamily)
MEARESRKIHAGDRGGSAGASESRRVEDLALYEKWKGGDSAAFEALYHRYEKPIARYFKNRVSSPAHLDLTQETFAICIRRRDEFEFRSTFRTYIFGIARHLLLGHRESRKYTPLEDVASVIAHDLTSPSSRMDKNRKLERLYLLVSQLPEDKRDLLQCRFRFEFSSKELAEHFDTNAGAVRTRLSRILDDLRAAFSEQERLALAVAYPRNKLIAELVGGPGLTDSSAGHVTKPKSQAPPGE